MSSAVATRQDAQQLFGALWEAMHRERSGSRLSSQGALFWQVYSQLVQMNPVDKELSWSAGQLGTVTSVPLKHLGPSTGATGLHGWPEQRTTIGLSHGSLSLTEEGNIQTREINVHFGPGHGALVTQDFIRRNMFQNGLNPFAIFWETLATPDLVAPACFPKHEISIIGRGTLKFHAKVLPHLHSENVEQDATVGFKVDAWVMDGSLSANEQSEDRIDLWIGVTGTGCKAERREDDHTVRVTVPLDSWKGYIQEAFIVHIPGTVQRR